MVSTSRQADRLRVQVIGTLHGFPSRPFPVAVVNVSAEGCGIEAEHALPLGAELFIVLGELEPIRAEVVWSEGNYAGLKYETPLSSRALFHLRIVNMLGRTTPNAA